MSKWDYPGCVQRPGTESSKKRKARRKREKKNARYGGREGYAHTLPCPITLAGDIDFAHFNHAGMGGTDRPCWEKGWSPLRHDLHTELDEHTPGRTWRERVTNFSRKHGVDLFGIFEVCELGFKNNWPAAKVRAEWKQYGGR